MFLLTCGGKHCTKTLITAAKEIAKHLHVELSLQCMYPICEHHLERVFLQHYMYNVHVFSYQINFVANNESWKHWFLNNQQKNKETLANILHTHNIKPKIMDTNVSGSNTYWT